MNALRLALVSWGFVGCSPVAPRALASLAAALLAWRLAPLPLFALWPLAAVALLAPVGRALLPWSRERSLAGARCRFVLGDALALWVAVLWPAAPGPVALFVAFCLVRFFAVASWPRRVARRFEADPLARGLLAGLQAWVVLAAARLFLGDARLWDYDAASIGGW